MRPTVRLFIPLLLALVLALASLILAAPGTTRADLSGEHESMSAESEANLSANESVDQRSSADELLDESATDESEESAAAETVGLNTPDTPASDEASEDAENPARRTKGIEEILVTATRRAESIQEVPISIAALSGDTIRKAGVTEFDQLDQFVPNMKILPSADTRSTSIRIRGIGSTGTNAGIDPSVGVFIDGVYQGRAGMSVGDLLDIERVEVLRGPQGTLFGKNTAAGAINITTRRPNYEFETVLEAKIGNYETMEFRGSVNAPIVDDRVALRVSGYKVRRIGWDTNRLTGDKVNDNNKYGVRSKIAFDIDDEFSVILSGDYSSQDDTCCVADIVTYAGQPLLGTDFDKLRREPYAHPLGDRSDPLRRNFLNSQFAVESALPKEDPFDRVVGANFKPRNIVRVGGVAVDALWEHEGHTIRWLNAYRKYTSNSRFDGDFSIFNAVDSWTNVDFDQVSSELIWTSPIWDKFDLQGGLYAYYSTMNTVDLLAMSDFYIERSWLLVWGGDVAGVPTAGIVNINDNTHELLSLAAYAQGTYRITDEFSLKGGLRLTHERKTRQVTSNSTWKAGTAPIGGGDIALDQSRSATNPQGLAVLQYFPMDDIMLYASFSNGFKSGGFNQVRTNDEPSEFDDELALNYEAGVKSSWFDRRLIVNLTGFFTDYNDFQAQLFDGASINVRNAGRLFSYGLEGEISYAPIDELQLGASLGFNRARYHSFENAEATAGQQAEAVYSVARELNDEFKAAHPNLPSPYEPLPRLDMVPALYCGNSNLTHFLSPSNPRRDEVIHCNGQDLTGERLDNVPEWSIALYASSEIEVPKFPVLWFSRIDWSFNSSYYLNQDLDPNLKQESYNLVNMRTGIREESGFWELIFWVTNVTDEAWLVSGFDVPVVGGYAAVNGPPRQYGATVRVSF